MKTALAHSVPEASAQLVVATAHRSKGREWDRVELASDLDEALQEATEAAEEGGAADNAALRDEQMLCYVAVTRAKTALAPGGVIAPELYTAASPPVVGMTSVFGEAAARERTAGESVSVTVEFSAAELSQISGTAGETSPCGFTGWRSPRPSMAESHREARVVAVRSHPGAVPASPNASERRTTSLPEHLAGRLTN